MQYQRLQPWEVFRKCAIHEGDCLSWIRLRQEADQRLRTIWKDLLTHCQSSESLDSLEHLLLSLHFVMSNSKSCLCMRSWRVRLTQSTTHPKWSKCAGDKGVTHVLVFVGEVSSVLQQHPPIHFSLLLLWIASKRLIQRLLHYCVGTEGLRWISLLRISVRLCLPQHLC